MYDVLEFLFAGVVFVIGCVLLLALIIVPIAFFDYQGKESACAEWQVETNRQVKFVSDLPFYWDCLIKTESGWISGSKLEQIETPNINSKLEEQNQ